MVKNRVITILILVTTVVLISSVMILTIVACEPVEKEPSEPTTEVPTRLYPNLSDPDRFPPHMVEIKAVALKEVYEPEEKVEVEFLFVNIYDETIVLNCPPEIWVKCYGLTIEAKSPEDYIVRSISGGSEGLVIQKHSAETFRFVWDQKDDEGRLVVPGYYYIRVNETPVSASGKEGNRLTEEFRIFIQYAQGAMDKVVEVNKSKTIKGVPIGKAGEGLFSELTIKLEKVELTDNSARFVAIATLPEYIYEDSHNYYPMHWFRSTQGEYSFNGFTKSAGGADEEPCEYGFRLIWGGIRSIDPIPSDAKELIFRVKVKLEDYYDLTGTWYGPWEFKIPLE